MTPRKLLLHVGPPKTGTSALQTVLSTLDDPGFLYPRVGLWDADGAHHGLVFNFYGEYRHGEVPRLDLPEMLAEIGALARAHPERDLVISSEELAERDIPPLVAALSEAVEDETLSPEIIFVCREHWARASSLYNQYVKDGFVGLRMDPDDYLRQTTLPLCYRPTLERLQSCGYPLRVLNYHPSNTFVARALAHMGSRVVDYPDPGLRNVSLSRIGLVAMLGLNNLQLPPQQREAVFALLRPHGRLWAPTRDIFSQRQHPELAARFADDRAYLRREFAVELPEFEFSPEGVLSITHEELAWLADVLKPASRVRKPLLTFGRRYLERPSGAWRRARTALKRAFGLSRR